MFWYLLLASLAIPKSIQSRFSLAFMDNQPIAIVLLVFSLVLLMNIKYKNITLQLFSLLLFYKILLVLLNLGSGILDILQIVIIFNLFTFKVKNIAIYKLAFAVFTLLPLGLYWFVGGDYGEFGFSLVTSRLTSTYGGPNVVGFVNVLMFIALMERKDVINIKWLSGLLALTGLCILLSASRGAIFCLALYVIVRHFKLALILGVMIFFVNIEGIIAFSRVLNGAALSDSERLEKFAVSVENISIFGNGPGTVPAWFFKFDDLLGIGDPHSLYLTLLLEDGIFGFVIYSVIVFFILKSIDYNKYLFSAFLVLGIVSSDFLKNPAVLVCLVLASKFMSDEKFSPRASTLQS